MNSVMYLLVENFSPEQVARFPTLVDLSAQLLVQERVETLEDDWIFLDCPVAYFLSMDLQAGLQAVCKAWGKYGNPDAELVGERILGLTSDSDEVEKVLRDLSVAGEVPEIKLAAKELLVEICKVG